MHPLNQEFDLRNLRRQLEEILAIINADHNGAPFNRHATEEVVLSVHEKDEIAAEPNVAVAAEERRESDTARDAEPTEVGQSGERDDLYDDALVVVTEFGHASPAMLQMWLSIDYGRAITILNRLQADGMISSKGKVRHKAFSLRRSQEQQV